MTPEERERCMDRLEFIDLELDRLDEERHASRCRCGRGECFDCALARSADRDWEELRDERHVIRQRFPEIIYQNEWQTDGH